jgi:hypothetical protein
MKRFLLTNRVLFIHIAVGMALALYGALFANCSFFNSFSEDDFAIDSIRFNAAALELPQGAMDILSVSIEPANAQPQAQVSWDFDGAVIQADTDNYGMVLTGLKPGETTVRVTSHGKTASCVVTVLPGSGEPSPQFPYIYSSVDVVVVRPGATAKAAVSLYGGAPSDSGGFSFSIDKPSVASLTTEGNYVWIAGLSEGAAKVTARHNKATYAFSFLVFCQADSHAAPYITTKNNVITINKSLDNEVSFAVELKNSPAVSSEGLFVWSLVDASGAELIDPPASLFAAGNQAALAPLRVGECYVRAAHPAALYALDVLVRVIEQIDTAHIEPSANLVRLSGSASEVVSLSLVNLPPGTKTDGHEFQWRFPPGAEDYLAWRIYGSGAAETGDSVWLTAKKSGAVVIAASHPLSPLNREILVVIRDLADEAARASAFISTSQNYVRVKAGDGDIPIAVHINNAAPGDEAALAWRIEHTAADGNGGPVIAWISGAGEATHASPARSAVPVATGQALISPLREGKAILVISHPKAVYNAKILVEVLPAGVAADAPFALSAQTPYAAIKNGTAVDLAATLRGNGKTPADEQAVSWEYNGANLSIQANGAVASVAALGFGTSRETIIVSHPKAARPLSIAVFRYDTDAEKDSAKYIYPETPYYALNVGETAYLAVQAVNLSASDSLSWRIDYGADCVSLNQLDKSNAVLTAVSPGNAEVTATLAGTGETAVFHIAVKRDGVVNEDAPCYLTTSQNVVVLGPGAETGLAVIPVNISESRHAELQWSVSDPALVALFANGAQATVRSLAGGGKALITVSHPLAANTLELNVHVGDEYEYKNTDAVYIDVPVDVLNLHVGDEDALLRAVLAHTELSILQTTGFSFATQDSAIAAVSWSSTSNACFVSPKAPGQTILTISHPEAVCGKEVLVIVDRAEGDSGAMPYITTAQNVVTVASGDYAIASVALANGSAYDSAAWKWETYGAGIAQIAADNGSTAMIKGGVPGTAVIAVSHADCPYPLKLIVVCLDAAVVRLKPWIQTSANIVTVKAGAAATLTANMAGGDETDHAGFLWSVSDSSVALLSGSGGSVSVRGMSPGMAYITVRNTHYPDSYAKTILATVEDSAQDGVYIAVNQRIIKLKPEAKDAAAVKATLVGGDALDPQHFIWWADDYNIVNLTALTDSARIEPRGVSGSTVVHVKHPKALETADIAVLVSAFDQFGFAGASKTVRRGAIAFVPMEKPAAAEQTVIEYASADTKVCAIAGSNAVCMIAGISAGYTTVTATLRSDAGVIAVAEMAVIVSPVAEGEAAISTQSTILNMETGQSMTVEAALKGAGLSAPDDYDLSWQSSDQTIASLLATEQNLTKGKSAYVTARNPGEAVLTVSHPKAETDLQIWIVIPRQNEVSIALDQAFLELYKDEGAVSVTATLTNGSSADYNSISWTAPKVGGQVIVSVSKSNGRTCNIVPRAVGRTTLRAQLPNGKFADCIVSVNSSSELIFESQAVHVNPGRTEIIRYSVNPESAQMSWIAQSNTAADSSEYFTFSVNEAAKTIAITGVALGGGSINAYFVSSVGGNASRIQVYVEYTYEFDLLTSGIIAAEPRSGNVMVIPFRVYPADLEVTATVSDPRMLEVKSVSQNTVSGTGEAIITPLGERNGLYVTLRATNPQDPVNTPLIRVQYINLYYQNLTILPVFDMDAGAFSRYDPGSNTLYLGDGEQALFHLDILEENAELTDLQVLWQSVNGASEDNKATGNGGHITLARESGASDSGAPLWRISHKQDHLSDTPFYLITKEPFYTVKSIMATYRDYGSTMAEDATYLIEDDAVYSSAQGQGITEWWVEVH